MTPRLTTFAYLPALVALALLAGCSSQPDQPSWLNNADSLYPQSRYLSASGDGATREAAAERALANLARVFSVAVSDTSMDFAQARVEGSGAAGTVSNTQEASRFITAEARQVLEGARIAETWQSPEAQFHSLAVLDKAPAAARLRRDVSQADQRTQDLVNYASGPAPNPVAAISALEKARVMQLERDYVNRNLSVVSGRGVTSPHSPADIEQMIRRGLSQLGFASQGDNTDMDYALQSAIAALGIRNQADAAYVLQGERDFAPVYQRQGWYWLRGSIQLRLTRSGAEIARKRWPVKVSATDEGLVQQRSRDVISAELPNYLYQMLSSSPTGF